MQHKLFSIILFILLTTEITGQVVIKEKVNLTESVTGTGQQSIVTQYYADIAVTIYWVPAIAKLVQINFHTDNIWTDTTSTIIGCDILCDDDHHSCFFSGGQTSKWQRGQVKGTSIWFEVKECQQIDGHYQWVNIPYEIRPGSTVRDTLFVYKSSSGTTKWYLVGLIYRRDVVAPECSYTTNYCTSNELTLPSVEFQNVPNGYNGIDVCNDSINRPLGVFNPFLEDSSSNIEVDICFDKETQRWWFSVANNNTLFIKYILAICSENIPEGKELIYDWQDFPSGLGCDKMMDELIYQSGYGATGAHYILQSIVEIHEEQHKNDFLHFLNENLSNFYANLLIDPKTCSDYNSIEEAMILWNENVTAQFNRLKRQIRMDHGDYESSFKGWFEQYFHFNSMIIQGAVLNQINFMEIFYGC